MRRARTGQRLGAYRYNALGERVKKMSAGLTYYHYDLDDRLLAETDALGETRVEYLYLGGEPLALGRSGQLYYYHNDHLGTPQKLTDGAQNVVWSAVYEPFGEAVIETGYISQNLRFPGQYYDEESGLHYNLNRYYDPKLGRYLTSDPIGLDGGLNTYLYANANPVRYIDPVGESAVARALPFVGGAVVADGPLPIGDLIALGILGGAAIYDICTESDEEREKRCEENLERDLETCRAPGKRGGKAAYRVCEQQAMLRYSNCLAGRDDGAPLPPWGDTY